MFGSIKDNNVNTKGIGLGLVISRMIVKKFGGQIDFISKFKSGSTFYFTFGVDVVADELMLDNHQMENSNFSI